jgi:hypothetical protein
VERILERPIDVPERLSILANKEKVSIEMNIKYDGFKNQLLSTFNINK